MAEQPKMASRHTNFTKRKYKQNNNSVSHVSKLCKPGQPVIVYSETTPNVIRAKSNSASVFAPSRDTAAAIVQRCTTGEQLSCTFYTAEPVWSFLQRGTEMRESERPQKRNTQQAADLEQAKRANEPMWPSDHKQVSLC